jgi:hypothetical protein
MKITSDPNFCLVVSCQYPLPLSLTLNQTIDFPRIRLPTDDVIIDHSAFVARSVGVHIGPGTQAEIIVPPHVVRHDHSWLRRIGGVDSSGIFNNEVARANSLERKQAPAELRPPNLSLARLLTLYKCILAFRASIVAPTFDALTRLTFATFSPTEARRI